METTIVLMGKYDIERSTLKSTLVRKSIAGDDGVRVITRAGTSSDGFGGVLGVVQNIFSGLLNLGTWIIKSVISSVSFTFTAVWGFIVSASVFIFNFNWNITDQQIEQRFEAIKNSLAAQYGGAIGESLGHLLCGIVPGAAVFAFNEPLGLYLLKEVGEEALDTLASNVQQLIRSTAISLTEAWMYNHFKNVRRLIKLTLKDPNSPQSRFVKQLFGTNFNKMIEAWGSEGSEPWSFAIALEDAIDNIENPALRNFTEELLEELFEGCVEMGYVVARSLDTWLLQQRQLKDTVLGDEKVVTIQPDRTQDETIVLGGKTEFLKPALTNVMSNYGMVQNRDIGQIVGTRLYPSIKKPIRGITARIVFSSNEFENNWSQGEVIADYIIPNVERSKLDWITIKRACGGNNGYRWGNWKATLNTAEGNQIAVYGGSESDAAQRAEAFLELSDDHLYTLNVTKETDKGERAFKSADNSIFKRPTQIYPIWVTIINYVKVFEQNAGRRKRTGRFRERQFRLPLWTDTKPPEWDEIIQDILSPSRL